MDVTPSAIAKRFRQELLRRDIPSDSEAARAAEVPQQWLSRRLTGETPWRLPELENVCERLGLSLDYVIGGERPGGGIPVESLVKLLTDHVGGEAPDPKATRVDLARDTEAPAPESRNAKAARAGKQIASAMDARKRRQN